MANEAAAASPYGSIMDVWTCNGSFGCVAGTSDCNCLSAQAGSASTDVFVLWCYSGPLAGYVNTSTVGGGLCPTTSSAKWN
jgi:hypothetical protein